MPGIMNSNKTTLRKDQKKLLAWYNRNKRPLPWRKNRDPYRVWISEVMLQQTTVTAVIPYYENFLKNFPTLQDLAHSKEKMVLKNWAGLGYYSRAKNLHKAAQILNKTGFPKTFTELIKIPGFGPYTSRAVTSISFNEEVGTLDGNVIRVLSRKNALKKEWWKPKGRKFLQDIADEMVSNTVAGETNQAMMELGSTLCTPTSPTCFLCPWRNTCRAHEKGQPEKFPLKRPKAAQQVWSWQVKLIQRKDKVILIPNDYTPFLKKQFLFPGAAKQLSSPPKFFHFKHSITCHNIYVTINQSYLKDLNSNQRKISKWFALDEISETNPSSLIKKVLSHS